MALFEDLESALVLSHTSTADLLTNNFDTPPSRSNNFGTLASLSITPVQRASDITTTLVSRGNYQTALSVLANNAGLPTLHIPNKVDLGVVYSSGFASSVAEFRSDNSLPCLQGQSLHIPTTIYTGDQTLDNLVISIKQLQGTTGGINTLLLK